MDNSRFHYSNVPFILIGGFDMKRIVLDASAIINGIPMLIVDGLYITSPSVIDEVQSKRGRKTLQKGIDLDLIEQRMPKAEFIEKIREAAEQTKDALSEADIEVLALALEFEAEIATDDYGIQNIAEKLGLKIIPVGEAGIRKVLHWQYYCPACKRKYEMPGLCGVCGTRLKRKAKKTH